MTLFIGQASATQITVTASADNILGSLRTSIMGAVAGDTIMFDAGILDGIPILLTSEITIDKSLVIMGNGHANTMILGTTSRIFNLINAGSVVIANLALEGGQTTGNGGAILST
ncbi:MAG: hypothetical protein KDD63_02790, partial [Bacteroidetes bacterium]|nr:hypothetical protein [Bacteroidota bacterium]